MIYICATAINHICHQVRELLLTKLQPAITSPRRKLTPYMLSCVLTHLPHRVVACAHHHSRLKIVLTHVLIAVIVVACFYSVRVAVIVIIYRLPS